MSTSTPQVRRRPRARTAEGGRRLQSAGAAVVVALVALLVGVFLNARGVHKSATIQPEGWKRHAALAVTGPLEDVSSALLLDRPRRALKAVLGRTSDDSIDTSVAVPQPTTTPAGGGTGTPQPHPVVRTKFTPKHKLRMWIAGDSLVVVPGESIEQAAAGSPVLDPVGPVDGRIATGLERPDVFNWFTHLRQVMRKDRPNAVILMFGANDDHDYMTGLAPGLHIGAFDSKSWIAEYRRRVGGLMDTVARNGAFLVWIGLPITRDPAQTRRFDTINAIVQSEAANRKGRVAYLDTYFSFAGDDGGYAEYLPNDSGQLVKMRADDGVHFERSAGELIARQVLHQLNERFDLTSWRRASEASR